MESQQIKYNIIMPQDVPFAVNCGKCKQHMLFHGKNHALHMHCCGVIIDLKCMVDDVTYKRNNQYIHINCPSCGTHLSNC